LPENKNRRKRRKKRKGKSLNRMRICRNSRKSKRDRWKSRRNLKSKGRLKDKRSLMRKRGLNKRGRLSSKEKIKGKEKKRNKGDKIRSARTRIHSTISQDQLNSPPRSIEDKLIKKRKSTKEVTWKIRCQKIFPKQMQMSLKSISIRSRKNQMVTRKSLDLDLEESKNGN